MLYRSYLHVSKTFAQYCKYHINRKYVYSLGNSAKEMDSKFNLSH